MSGAAAATVLLSGGSSSGTWPAIPTREEVCGVRVNFQNQIISTRQYGTRPWFEPIVPSLTDPADRQWVYQQKKAGGDRHQIIEFNTEDWGPNPSPQRGWPWGPIPSMEDNPDVFLALTEEVIMAGLIPIVAFDGDDGQVGAVNALRQLPILMNIMQHWSSHGDLTPYILFARLWDGVFYGSTPEQIRDFGIAFRALCPQGHLAIEHNPGHIPAGEGGEDYAAGGRLSTYDVILSEFDDPPHNDTTWQIAGRLVHPYNRPADQPSWDDPPPTPFYLAPGNPRGPYFAVAFETWAPYSWVRVGDPLGPAGQAMKAEIDQRRQYYRDLGYTYTG